jgi:two-component system response regulator ArlR
MKLLLAEDEPRLLKSLKHIFQRNQYVVDAVATGTDALAYAETAEYDGLVLDIMLPGLDGLEVLRRLRSQGVSTPALFLTARSEVYQRVEGLDAGADDYLAKPFSTAELLARVRAMLRRKDNYLPDLLRAGPLQLNRSAYTLSCGAGTQSLSGREFQIMEMLMQRPSFIVTVDEIMAHVWGWDSEADVSVIWVHISNIRKKLAQLQAPVSIRFVRSAGYVLEVRA